LFEAVRHPEDDTFIMRQLDTQQIELLGRQRLISDLIHAGLEVAIPSRDRGIDLIAFVDLASQTGRFVARPIQMKAASLRSFGVYRKYERISNLLIAYVWHLSDPGNACTFALTYAEAEAIAYEMGWTRTASWRRSGYNTNNPSKRLLRLLGAHRMTPDKWWRKVAGRNRGA
jgi:hypothetical protein